MYFYSWNIAKDESKFEITYNAVKDSGFRFYSYDRGECEKYGLKFNTIMYDRTLTLQTDNEKYYTLFLGYLTDRKEDILSLYDMFTSAGLTPRFVIVSKGERKEKFPFEYRDDYVGYYDYLKMVGTSRAILDIAQQKQDGYSMRVMERQGITEEMKARDQMEWVRAVNGIRNMAEEIVLKELVNIKRVRTRKIGE